jgi:hypothetical protein
MNKYLLLRDNKQSGPYTVPEIIAKGIKPYDLVWLEGKSAAWRYPSELEELKAFAPTVEEQPFDRFYKKPEPENQSRPLPERNSRFEPVIAEETTKKPDAADRKVYINFPGGPKKVPVYQPPNVEQPAVAPVAHYSEPVTSLPAKPARQDKKLLYTFSGACLILVLVISVLAVNYATQSNDIRQLNEKVQEMEKKRNNDYKTSVAAHQITVPVAAVNTASVTPEPLVSAAATTNYNVREKPVTRPAKTPAIAVNPTKNVVREQQEPEEQLKITPPQQKETVKENLFNLVSVKSNKYKTGVLGGISNLQLELTNNSQQPLQKVTVEIKYLSPEKKVVKTQTVYFENVSAGSQPTLNVPKSNRGISITYVITEIKS